MAREGRLHTSLFFASAGSFVHPPLVQTTPLSLFRNFLGLNRCLDKGGQGTSHSRAGDLPRSASEASYTLL